MICTKGGYPSSAVGAETQAAYLAQTYTANLASGVKARVWYEWKDSRDEPLNSEACFGLLTAGGTEKTLLDGALFPRLLDMRFARRLKTGSLLVQALLFEERGVEHVVTWVRSGDPRHRVEAVVGDEPVRFGISPMIVVSNRVAAAHAR